MRKIEQEMIEAIDSNENWTKINTRVKSFHNDEGHMTNEVYLHDNVIAIITGYDFRIAHCNWITQTTKSRLNALISEYASPSCLNVHSHRDEYGDNNMHILYQSGAEKYMESGFYSV